MSAYIDHTLLKPAAEKGDVDVLCEEANKNEFAAVCIPPFYLQHAYQMVEQTKVNLATVIGFPLGYNKMSTKTEEARKAIDDGADELDMVMNITAFKSGMMEIVQEEIESVVTLARMNNKIVKVIIETGLLDNEEILQACTTCAHAGVDYVKTCTGFNGGQAEVDTIALMRKHLPNTIKIKASGGIKEVEKANELIKAGADRLGTSSGLKLIAHE